MRAERSPKRDPLAVAARDEAFARLREELGYVFEDAALLERSIRHSSYANERAHEVPDETHEHESNERLEFLGDAVLALVVAESLYAAKPDWREGDLTRSLHAIVEGRSLTALARSLGVGPALLLGRTEESSAGRDKASILENAMEAIIGAIYLDGGIDPVRLFVGRHFADALAADAVRVERDPKTELQETLMAEVGAFPSYRLVRDSEVEGDDRRFEIEVHSEGAALGRGIGRTKRAAEKAAARAALEGRRASREESGKEGEAGVG